MLINLNIGLILDEVVSLSMEYEEYRRKFIKENPNGLYVNDNTPLYKIRDYINEEKTSKNIDGIMYVFRDTKIDIIGAARVVRRFYEKNHWQFCLKDEEVEKLIKLFTEGE